MTQAQLEGVEKAYQILDEWLKLFRANVPEEARNAITVPQLKGVDMLERDLRKHTKNLPLEKRAEAKMASALTIAFAARLHLLEAIMDLRDAGLLGKRQSCHERG